MAVRHRKTGMDQARADSGHHRSGRRSDADGGIYRTLAQCGESRAAALSPDGRIQMAAVRPPVRVGRRAYANGPRGGARKRADRGGAEGGGVPAIIGSRESGTGCGNP
uniref:Predicted protein n=1 Tax=Physcomitrium patens TaxID=3218 RepID=A9U6D4_PHYPA